MQEIDSVEYGLTDIQEYYANTGALKKAAENKGKGKFDDDGISTSNVGSKRGVKKVAVSVVETFEKKVNAKELEDTLRIEYRSKLLNPKW